MTSDPTTEETEADRKWRERIESALDALDRGDREGWDESLMAVLEQIHEIRTRAPRIICGHCKAEFTDDPTLRAHLGTCDKSPLVAELARLRERVAMATAFDTGINRGANGNVTIAKDDTGWRFLSVMGRDPICDYRLRFPTADAAFEALAKVSRG